MLEKTMFLWKR